MSARLLRLSLVPICLGLVAGCLAASASAGPLLGRWEGHSAKGATVAFLLGEYQGEALIADAGVLCPPGADPEDADAAGRTGQLDPYYYGNGKSIRRPLQPIEDGIIDSEDSERIIARGSLGHSTGVITKVQRLQLPCRVGTVRVHHVDTAPRPDGSYSLAALPAGSGHVTVTAGGAFVAVEASLTLPSVNPENPAPCFPYYSTGALETHGGGDAFGVLLDEASVATENAVMLTGAFTAKGTIAGGFAGSTSYFGGQTCAVVAPFVAKAPKKEVLPRLDLNGAAVGGQAD